METLCKWGRPNKHQQSAAIISSSGRPNAISKQTNNQLFYSIFGRRFGQTLKQSVLNAYLHIDTLICELDSVVLLSFDKGYTFRTYSDSSQRYSLINKYIKGNKSKIKNHKFTFKENVYYKKELFQNNLASVIVCYGPETLTDYYFVSFDKGKNWTFLQKDFGDNRQRFLLKDKYLYCYRFPFGLQRLKLK